MVDPAFAELVTNLTEAFGQQMGSSRQSPEGILLETTDGFLYAFIAEPDLLSLATVQRFAAEAPQGARHLVVFCRGRLPLAFSAELLRAGATVVEGARFTELVHSLGFGTFLGEEPRPERPMAARLLPSARSLDTVMSRAENWLAWGVPALSLRFFRQAAELKPEYLPARNGVATSLLHLGLIPEARKAYAEVRLTNPENLEARIGEAAVLGAEGHSEEEIDAYRTILAERPEELTARTHLIAALVEHHHWGAAREEIATLLERVPEDVRLRFLHSVALEKSGATREAEAERERARRLGLTPERERALSEQLGLPVVRLPKLRPSAPPALAPPPSASVPPAPAAPAVAKAPRKRRKRRRSTPERKPRRPSRTTRRTRRHASRPVRRGGKRN
jgi:tetratricopeptide (TPR) repeat protein